MDLTYQVLREHKLHVCFWYDNNSCFERVKEYLRNDYDLVDPTVSVNDCLVFEDSENIGRYRITFMTGNEDHWPHDSAILFRYWESRLTPEIIDKNPMQKPMREVYYMFQPRLVTDLAIMELDFP